MHNIIFFELNEVPYKIIDHFSKLYPESATAKLLKKAAQYETFCPDEGHLHPWSTWPTLHRGIPNSIHKLKDFGQSVDTLDTKYPPVWKILNKSGIKSGIFSSIYSYPLPKDFKDYSFYFPDPFAAEPVCHPEKLQPILKFNLDMTRQSIRNVNNSISKNGLMKVGLSLLNNGLSLRTVFKIIKQLIDEQTKSWKKTRRRTVQTMLAFDLYIKLLKKKKPQYTSFMSNHMAATMHRFWAATFPQDYENFELSDEWKKTYQNEIGFAFKEADYILGRLIKFVEKEKNYTLLVGSSMGQVATQAKPLESELTLQNPNTFLKFIEFNIENCQIVPAMHPQYNFKIDSDYNKNELIKKIKNFKVNGEEIEVRAFEDNLVSVNLGQTNLKKGSITFNNNSIIPEEAGLQNTMIDEGATGTAYHDPKGIMLIYNPNKSFEHQDRKQISSLNVVPSILKNYKIPVPNYMEGADIPEIYQ